jgi:hypothetical protein
MAKKHKRNLQELLEKKRQLQQIQKTNSGSLPEMATVAVAPGATKTSSTEPLFSATQPRRVIGRTLVSVLIVALLLSGSVIASRETDYLNQFGAWLYQALRLAQP